MIYIPVKLLISEDTIDNSELAIYLKNAPKKLKNSNNWISIKFALFLLLEKSKGIKSFWFPYLRILAVPDLLTDWSENELKLLHNEKFINSSKNITGRIYRKWELVDKYILKQNKEFFSDVLIYNLQEFKKAIVQVETRVFGWKLPSDFLVPLIDCINHDPGSKTMYGILNKEEKKECVRTHISSVVVDAELDHSIIGVPMVSKEENKEKYVEVKGVKINAKEIGLLENMEEVKVWELDLYSSSASEESSEDSSNNSLIEEEKESEEGFNNSDESENSEEEIEKEYEKYLARIKDQYEREMLSKVSFLEKSLIIKQQTAETKSDYEWWKYNDPNLFFYLSTSNKYLLILI